MYSVRVDVEPGRYDALLAELWEAGTLGVVEGQSFLEAFFEDFASAVWFGEPVEAPEADWVKTAQDAWPPLLVGEKFFVVAPWRTEPTPPGRFRLEINPGLQCGTGRHPCTQLCLEAMERTIRPGDRVLDVGTGSGILSLAAKMLGAAQVVACDIDPDARPETERGVPFFVGSADAVRSGAVDVVVANISDIVIGELKREFERVAPRRILSGFQNNMGQWACLVEESAERD
jgi:ribosomal protein L11 methyltransferase